VTDDIINLAFLDCFFKAKRCFILIFDDSFHLSHISITTIAIRITKKFSNHPNFYNFCNNNHKLSSKNEQPVQLHGVLREI
jgi:hypothetical protein